MYILVNESGRILSIAEKKLNDNYIKVEKVPEPFQIYLFKNGKFIKDKDLEKQYKKNLINKKRKKLSKIVTKYIIELLNYFDYDDLADLILCKNIPEYKDEVEKLEKWIKEVYKKYEELSNNIEKIDLENIYNLLPKYKG